ncbi:unnamed protein product, partial [Prorocentrum cordatum]
PAPAPTWVAVPPRLQLSSFGGLAMPPAKGLRGAPAAADLEDPPAEALEDLEAALFSPEGGADEGAAGGADDLQCDNCGKTPQEAPWADYCESIVRGITVIVPRGPACQGCWVLKCAWPLLEWSEWIELKTTTTAMARAVERATEKLQVMSLDEFLKSHVQSSERQGTCVKAKYLVYSLDEFLCEFQVPHEDLELRPVTVLNELRVPEKVIVIRDDSRPRTLTLYAEQSSVFSEDVLRAHIRKEQPAEAFQKLVDNASKQYVATDKTRMQMTTLSVVQTKSAKIIKDRTVPPGGATDAAGSAGGASAAASNLGGDYTPAWQRMAARAAAAAPEGPPKKKAKPAGSAPAAAGAKPSGVPKVASAAPAAAAPRSSRAARRGLEDSEAVSDLTAPGRPAKRRGSSVASGTSVGERAATFTHDTADGADGGFDLLGLITGTVQGQCIAGARRTSQSLCKAGQHRQAGDLDDNISIADMAHKLSPQFSEQTSADKMQDYMTKVEPRLRGKGGFPMSLRLRFASKSLDSAVPRLMHEELWTAMRPFALTTDFPEEGPPREQDQLEPLERRLSVLVPFAVNDELKSAAKAAMTNGFFGNSLICVCQEDLEKLRALVTHLVGFYDDAMGKNLITLQTVPDWLIEPFDEILDWCRAVAGIMNPEPGYLGSSADKICEVFNPKGRQALRPGVRSAVNALDKNAHWQELLGAFWDALEYESEEGPRASAVIAKLRTSQDLNELRTLFQEVREAWPAWVAGFREGALDGAKGDIKTILGKKIPELLTKEPQQEHRAMCEESIAIISAVFPDNLERFKADYQGIIDGFNKGDALDQLKETVTSWTGGHDDIDVVQGCLDRCRGHDVDEDLASHLIDCRNFVFVAAKMIPLAMDPQPAFDKLACAATDICAFKMVRQEDARNKRDTDAMLKEFLSVGRAGAAVAESRAALRASTGAADKDRVHNLSALKENINAYKCCKVTEASPSEMLVVKEAFDGMIEDCGPVMDETYEALKIKYGDKLQSSGMRLEKVNGGCKEEGKWWLDGVAADAGIEDLVKRGDSTVKCGYMEAIRKRGESLRAELSEAMTLHKSMGKEFAVDQNVMAACLRGAATTFEARMLQAHKMQGLTKKKHINTHRDEFTEILKQFGQKPESWAHKTLWAAAQES